MAQFTFQETLNYFSEKIGAYPPEEDREAREVELVVDQIHVIISEGAVEGSLKMETTLGLMVQPVRESRLQELATSNFLGVNTGGCTLAFDEEGVTLKLLTNLTTASSPQENWEWLHRLLHVAAEWNKTLSIWEEFVPLYTLSSGEELMR